MVGSLCVAPAAINNRHYFNYQQPSAEREADDSFIIMSLQYGPGFSALLPSWERSGTLWMGRTLRSETLSENTDVTGLTHHIKNAVAHFNKLSLIFCVDTKMAVSLS